MPLPVIDNYNTIFPKTKKSPQSSKILLKLGFDGDFFSFSTYSRAHGHHGRFLVSPDALKLAMETDKTVFDKDCNNFIEIRTQHSGERIFILFALSTHD